MTMFKRVKLALFVGLLVLVAFLISSQYIYYGSIEEYIPHQKMVHYEKILDGQAVVVKWGDEDQKFFLQKNKSNTDTDIQIGKRYIVSKELLLSRYRLSESYDPKTTTNTYRWGEYAKFVVYDTTKDMSSKEIDLFKVVRAYNQDYVPNLLYTLVYGEHKDEYLRIRVFDTSSGKLGRETPRKNIYLNLETEKIYSEEEMSDVSSKYDFLNIDNALGTIEDKFLIIGFLSNKGVLVGENNIFLSNDKENDQFSKEESETWLFKKKYPEAYQLFLDGGELYLLKDSTDLDLQVEALSLFFPEGTNIFENTKINTYYSKDGQEHTVNSLEEFKQYYKTESEE